MMGGAAGVRGGPGEKVERLYREVRVNAIAGGSEEVLMDRQWTNKETATHAQSTGVAGAGRTRCSPPCSVFVCFV
jgi:hypothetical protein